MITKNSKNILLADDSGFFRTKLGVIFTDAGHKVTLAADGREVEKKLQKDAKNIDLLTIELQMPHIDGFGILEWMKKNGYIDQLPVVVITGVNEPGDVVDRLSSLGASAFMTKSHTPEQILNCINRILFSNEANTRRAPRVPVSESVDYTLEGKGYIGFLCNISASGLFLRTSLNLSPGSELGFKFSLPDSKRVFDIKGIVKWSTPVNAITSYFGGAAVMFTSISNEEKEEIRRFVEKEQKRLELLS
jgi:CheY-like chemotaxis protein/Tfp pilus assembly protein PilZ